MGQKEAAGGGRAQVADRLAGRREEGSTKQVPFENAIKKRNAEVTEDRSQLVLSGHHMTTGLKASVSLIAYVCSTLPSLKSFWLLMTFWEGGVSFL